MAVTRFIYQFQVEFDRDMDEDHMKRYDYIEHELSDALRHTVAEIYGRGAIANVSTVKSRREIDEEYNDRRESEFIFA